MRRGRVGACAGVGVVVGGGGARGGVRRRRSNRWRRSGSVFCFELPPANSLALACDRTDPAPAVQTQPGRATRRSNTLYEPSTLTENPAYPTQLYPISTLNLPLYRI